MAVSVHNRWVGHSASARMLVTVLRLLAFKRAICLNGT